MAPGTHDAYVYGERQAMSGLVRTHHLVTCMPAIVREFGWRTYARCVRKTLFAPGPVTFLECVALGADAEPDAEGRRLQAP